ncbi:MAG: hypothetical protein IKQ56_08515 [Lachnospiraceae bacterium]|nr:hypothetical protein [Lachnospiraceae bacterium]
MLTRFPEYSDVFGKNMPLIITVPLQLWFLYETARDSTELFVRDEITGSIYMLLDQVCSRETIFIAKFIWMSVRLILSVLMLTISQICCSMAAGGYSDRFAFTYLLCVLGSFMFCGAQSMNAGLTAKPDTDVMRKVRKLRAAAILISFTCAAVTVLFLVWIRDYVFTGSVIISVAGCIIYTISAFSCYRIYIERDLI